MTTKKVYLMIFKFILLLSWTSYLLASEKLSYKELLDLNSTCRNDNCHEANNIYYARTCECDQKCVEFGDCCIDSIYSLKSSQMNSQVPCLDIAGHKLFAINKCLPGWTGDSKIKSSCENVSHLDERRDPFMKLPVTDPNSTITYKNRFCAVCNDVHYAIPWRLQLTEMWAANSYNSTYGNLTTEYVMKKIVFNEEAQNWGVWLYSYPQGWSFTSYEITSRLPEYLKSYTRVCRLSLIDECSDNWTDSVVRSKCEAYQAAVYIYIKGENWQLNQYKNIHCALCNYANITNPICTLPSPYGFPSFNFAFILDFNTSEGNIVGKKQLCDAGDVYDPFSKKCRPLVCGLPGFKLENGKCVAT